MLTAMRITKCATLLALLGACGSPASPDGGEHDSTVPTLDGGIDGGRSDAGIDAAIPDAGIDAAMPDGGIDAAMPDAAMPDAGTDAGPLVCSLEGDWNHGVFVMHFDRDTTWFFSNDPHFPESAIIARASWSATDAQLTIGGMDPSGALDECDTLVGIYDLSMSADCNTVTFTLVSDACDGRDGGVAFTWTRAGTDVGPCIVPDGDSDGHLRPVCGGDDCNDLFDFIYPGATEVCNGGDDNCDGRADEGFDCVQGLTTACLTSCGEISETTCSPSCTITCDPPTSFFYSPDALPFGCGTLTTDNQRCVNDASNCYLAYGPYVHSLSTGSYTAHYTVSSPTGAGGMVQVDVNDATGAGLITTMTTTISSTGDQTIDLPFTAPGGCDGLEFRIQVLSGDICYRSITVN